MSIYMSCLGKTTPKLSYLFFNSRGLNMVTKSFTDVRQFDPRWPVTVSAQRYIFVTKKFSWLWEQLILPSNSQNLLVGVDNVDILCFFFLLGKQVRIWKEKWSKLRLVVKTGQHHPSSPGAVLHLLRDPRSTLAALFPGSLPVPHWWTDEEHFFKVRPWFLWLKLWHPSDSAEAYLYQKSENFSYLHPPKINYYVTKGSRNFSFYIKMCVATKMLRPFKNTTTL